MLDYYITRYIDLPQDYKDKIGTNTILFTEQKYMSKIRGPKGHLVTNLIKKFYSDNSLILTL